MDNKQVKITIKGNGSSGKTTLFNILSDALKEKGYQSTPIPSKLAERIMVWDGYHDIEINCLQEKVDIDVNQNQKYLIWNRSYSGNSMLFWRVGKCGYTSDIDKAHKFTYEEAKKTIGSSDHQLVSLDYLQSIATRQINADHLDRDYLGKEVSNA